MSDFTSPGRRRRAGRTPVPAPPQEQEREAAQEQEAAHGPGVGPVPAATSALEAALARVGDRWSLLLVDALTAGPLRFSQLQHAVPGIATNVLSQRLRHLEASRVVIARRYSARPPRHSYELTAPGRELAGALRLLAQWGADTEDTALRAAGGPFAVAPTPEHGACGTPLEARWWCPTCGETVIDGDDEAPVFV